LGRNVQVLWEIHEVLCYINKHAGTYARSKTRGIIHSVVSQAKIRSCSK
jgi:hypothetical protein